jgi:hypothetical protein
VKRVPAPYLWQSSVIHVVWSIFAQWGQIGSSSGYSMQSTHNSVAHASHFIMWFTQNNPLQNGHSFATSSKISVSQMVHFKPIFFSVRAIELPLAYAACFISFRKATIRAPFIPSVLSIYSYHVRL